MRHSMKKALQTQSWAAGFVNYCYYIKCTSDPKKHAKNLAERGQDMDLDAATVYSGPHLTFDDIRFEYGEQRYVTIGHLNGCMMVIA